MVCGRKKVHILHPEENKAMKDTTDSIFGYTWEEIQARQQGAYRPKPMEHNNEAFRVHSQNTPLLDSRREPDSRRRKLLLLLRCSS